MVIWKGAAARATAVAFRDAAAGLGVQENVLRAVWEVEAAGRAFRADGSLERRFEPHHMPGSKLTWRDSLRIGAAAREAQLIAAAEADLTAALRASSWGAPQIMGFNFKEAGYPSPQAMVEAFADSEAEQLRGFAMLVVSWGLVSALRAQDWLAFARRYNGSGQPEVYARRMEAAYRRLSGKSSPQVLVVGSRGAAVTRLQEALGIETDGAFGTETLHAVEAFQRQHKLAVDGKVGAKTWAALEAARDARPMVQETEADAVLGAVERWAGIGTVAAGAAGTLGELRTVMPSGAYDLLVYGAVSLAFVAAAAWLIRRVRAR